MKNLKEEGENMKDNKILLVIPKLQNLDEERVDLIVNAINSCTIVQNLEKLKAPTDYTKKLEDTLNKNDLNIH
ncbi:hypothetical protein [Metaclostridioides mangenotii]|uniref:hypothetical protein n=1 Tax=Metaclostridioides mangenotii TaxID=1540 RepID=UPI000AD4C2A5|nr:hypothetical protein [Clostridioides mangenotii]